MGSILKLLARRSESAYSAFLGRDPWECARRHRKVNITSRDNKLNADFVVICAGVGCVCGVWSDWRSPGTGGPSFRPSSLPEFVPLSPSTPSVASSPLEPLPSPGVVSSGRATFPFGFALLVSLGPGALPPFGFCRVLVAFATSRRTVGGAGRFWVVGGWNVGALEFDVDVSGMYGLLPPFKNSL